MLDCYMPNAMTIPMSFSMTTKQVGYFVIYMSITRLWLSILPVQEEIAIMPPGLHFLSQCLGYFSMPAYHGNEQSFNMPTYHGMRRVLVCRHIMAKSKILVCRHMSYFVSWPAYFMSWPACLITRPAYFMSQPAYLISWPAYLISQVSGISVC
jgi:hypothetical protein